MSGRQLREMMALGWGVGNHSWTHGRVMDNPELELKQAMRVLADTVGERVTIYCAPGSHVSNLTREVQKKIREYGYLAGMSIVDDLNYSRARDLLYLNRSPVHERMHGIFDCSYDAHKRIRQAQEEMGWIIDYAHCPLEKAVHEYKDCTEVHHRRRLEAVVEAGGNECWFASPDDVVDYRYMRKHSRLARAKGKEGEYVVRIKNPPSQVKRRELSFELQSALTAEALAVSVAGKAVALTPVRAGVLSFTAAVRNGTKIKVVGKTSS